MTTVPISLSHWNIKGLLPDDGEESALLTPTGRLCCLGFACRAMGATDRDLISQPMPDDSPFGHSFPPESRELQNAMARANDGQVPDVIFVDSEEWKDYSLEDRIGFIITGFLEMGMEIEFVE